MIFRVAGPKWTKKKIQLILPVYWIDAWGMPANLVNSWLVYETVSGLYNVITNHRNNQAQVFLQLYRY